MRRLTSKRNLSIIAGCLVSLGFVAYALANLDWPTFLNSIYSIDLTWFSVFLITLLVTMILRAGRWQLIAGLPFRDWAAIWEASCIGYAGTAIFPARAGEVMRVVHLQRSMKASTGLAIGSSVVDRLVDALAICVLISIGLAVFVSNQAIEHRFIVMSAVLLCVCLGLAFFLLGGNRVTGIVAFAQRRGWGKSRLARWVHEAFTELQSLRDWRVLLALFGLQLLISVLDVMACWILLWAFGWTLPVTAALSTLICLAVASALPSTPGYVGVYQVAAMTALHPFALASSEALAYGTLLQVCNFGLFLAVGIWAFFRSRP